MRELRGEPCLEMNECVPTKQQIICSRSFAHRITEYREMQTIDKLNVSGRGTIWFAGQGIQKSWAMKREMLSPAYTTRYADLPVAK